MAITAVRVEPNYWMRRVTEEKAADARAERKQARADTFEEVLYALALTVLWALGTVVMLWKSVLPGGPDAILTFLILEGMYTLCVMLAWVKTR